MALWIATTDRRRADAVRDAEVAWNGDVALVDGQELYPYRQGADRYALELDWDFPRVFPAGALTLRS